MAGNEVYRPIHIYLHQVHVSDSETAPTQGTLKVFPDVLLSNAYLILRPFFRPLVATDSPDILDAKNWTFDISYAEFPGIIATNGGWHGPRPTPEMHPHLRLDDTMTSVPKVNPGDTVFWHCDMIHSVEQEHTGSGDSAGTYPMFLRLTSYANSYCSSHVYSCGPFDADE